MQLIQCYTINLSEKPVNKELKEEKGQTFIKAEQLFLLLLIYFCASVLPR